MSYARKLRSGKYVPVYRDPLTRDKRHVPGESYPTKELAETRADQYLLMLQGQYDGLGVETAPARNAPTLAAYGPEALKQVMGISASTRDKYMAQIPLMVKEYFGAVAVDQVTPEAVEDYVRILLARNTSESVLTSRLNALKHVIKRAAREGRTRHTSPAESWNITIRSRDRRYRPIISDPELQQVVAHMPRHLVPAVWLAHDSGLRVGEIAALTVECLDWDAQLITVAATVDDTGAAQPYTKNRRHRTVGLSDRACTALRNVLAVYPSSGRVLWNLNQNAPVKVPHLEYHMRKARKAAGIDWTVEGKWTSVQWHDLRRAFATRLYMNGEQLVTIQRMMGHASTSQTEKYILRYETEGEQVAAVRRAFDATAA